MRDVMWARGMQEFIGIEAFYAAGEERRSSGESDFGCWWWEGQQGHSDQWRVSAVEDTGEVYAICERPNVRGNADYPKVIVLGSLGPDPDYRRSYAVLDGWEEICGQAESLQWVVDKIKAAVEALPVPPLSNVERLQAECEYDPDGESSVDSLIEYKNALEDAYARDAAVLDKVAVVLRQSTWPGGADFLDWTAELVRGTGRDIDSKEATSS